MGGQDAHPSTQDAPTAPEPQIIITPQVTRGLVVDALRQFVGDEVLVEVIEPVVEVGDTETEIEDVSAAVQEHATGTEFEEVAGTELEEVAVPEFAEAADDSLRAELQQADISQIDQSHIDQPDQPPVEQNDEQVVESLAVPLNELVDAPQAAELNESQDTPVPLPEPAELPQPAPQPAPVVPVVAEPVIVRTPSYDARMSKNPNRETPDFPSARLAPLEVDLVVEIAIPLSNSEKSENSVLAATAMPVPKKPDPFSAPLPAPVIESHPVAIVPAVKKRPVLQLISIDWLGRLVQHPLLHMLAAIGAALLTMLWLLGG